MAIKLGSLKYNPKSTDKKIAYRDSICYRTDLQCQKEILLVTKKSISLMEASKEAKFLLVVQIQEMGKKLDAYTAKLTELGVDLEALTEESNPEG